MSKVKIEIETYNDLLLEAKSELPKVRDELRSKEIEYENAKEYIMELQSFMVENAIKQYELKDHDLDTVTDLNKFNCAIDRNNIDKFIGIGIDANFIKQTITRKWHEVNGNKGDEEND